MDTPLVCPHVLYGDSERISVIDQRLSQRNPTPIISYADIACSVVNPQPQNRYMLLVSPSIGSADVDNH